MAIKAKIKEAATRKPFVFPKSIEGANSHKTKPMQHERATLDISTVFDRSIFLMSAKALAKTTISMKPIAIMSLDVGTLLIKVSLDSTAGSPNKP